MRGGLLATLLAAWVIATAALCAMVHRAFALRAGDGNDHPVIASVWNQGTLVARAVLARPDEHDPGLEAALASLPLGESSAIRYETLVGDGPMPTFTPWVFALSLAPGKDGLIATLGDRTEYLTPDDLLARQAYRVGVRVPGVDLTLGVDVPLVLALLAERFGTTVDDLRHRAALRRARFERASPARSPGGTFSPDTLTEGDLRDAAFAAGRFLARGVDADGRLRYLVDGANNQTLSGYDWPRHAGGTYFLAQVAARSGDAEVAWATLRAAALLRDHVVACGPHRCVAEGDVADLGSTALAIVAFVEIAETRLDAAYALAVPDLAAFLRGQQRADGEFMHGYDRVAARPVDVQFLYYSGEAALALSRAHALLGDARDLDAAQRAVTHLVGPAWSFFGSRYYFGDEHWTCQAMADLWDRSPNVRALDFCLRWLGFWQRLQLGPGETPYDSDGAYGVGPFPVPALTPAASRCEAGLATLAVARRASGAGAGAPAMPREALVVLATQMRRSLALLLRQQFRALSPARVGLLADAAAVDGAFPASEVDWALRIDFAQHAGAALLAGCWLFEPK